MGTDAEALFHWWPELSWKIAATSRWPLASSESDIWQGDGVFCSTTVGRHTVSREWWSIVYTEMCRYADHCQDRIEEEMLNFSVRNPWQCSVELTGQPGRPPFLVPMDYIEALIEFGFTYEQMSAVLGISSRTLKCRRQEYGLPVGRNYRHSRQWIGPRSQFNFNGMFTYLDVWLFGPGPTPNHGWSVKQ